MLEDESINPAHHHDDIENDDERRHRSAETKAAMENHERNCQQCQPNVCAQPALHGADTPEHDFFSHTEQGGKDEDRQCDRTEDQTERRAADVSKLSRFLN